MPALELALQAPDVEVVGQALEQELIGAGALAQRGEESYGDVHAPHPITAPGGGASRGPRAPPRTNPGPCYTSLRDVVDAPGEGIRERLQAILERAMRNRQ